MIAKEFHAIKEKCFSFHAIHLFGLCIYFVYVPMLRLVNQ